MKKTLFALWLILLLCFSAQAQEYDYCAAAGGTAACGVVASQTSISTDTYLGYDTTLDRAYLASSFTASCTGTIYTLYVDMKKYGSAAQTITAYLCPDSSGHSAAVASCTVADVTLDASTLTNLLVAKKFNFTTGFAVTESTKYWVQLVASVVDAGSYVGVSYYGTVDGQAVEVRDAEGSGWTSLDSSGQFVFSVTTATE